VLTSVRLDTVPGDEARAANPSLESVALAPTALLLAEWVGKRRNAASGR
jgi:hypothetical protein